MSGSDCTDLSHCECVDSLYERIARLEMALQDIADEKLVKELVKELKDVKD